MIDHSVPKAERLRTARALALKVAIYRYRHELMGDEEKARGPRPHQAPEEISRIVIRAIIGGLIFVAPFCFYIGSSCRPKPTLAQGAPGPACTGGLES